MFTRPLVLAVALVALLAAPAGAATRFDRTVHARPGTVTSLHTDPLPDGSAVAYVGVWVDGHPATLVAGGTACASNYVAGGVFVRLSSCKAGTHPAVFRVANATTRKHRVRVVLSGAGSLGAGDQGIG